MLASAFDVSSVPETCIVLNCSLTKIDVPWILDSGATDHVVTSLDLFQDFKKVYNRFVKLPNGELIRILHEGTVRVNKDLVLSKDVQTKKVIGSASIVAGLYQLQHVLAPYSDVSATEYLDLASSQMNKKPVSFSCTISNDSVVELWHNRDVVFVENVFPFQQHESKDTNIVLPMCEKLSDDIDIFKAKDLKQKGSAMFSENSANTKENTANSKAVLDNVKGSASDNSSGSFLPVSSQECVDDSHQFLADVSQSQDGVILCNDDRSKIFPGLGSYTGRHLLQ
ncbi:hypothetical protein V6N11_073076 [Hibiscus sabdariffa]|uniref:Retrovirus-related Pol polyprotein from transposon TNT 1-94-like beta-barrel domain-containing protein n=1 Tax=Hibiscus sabdariffa TaxID=183260 RepID=A0ABR2NXF7_9ROSI